MDEIIRAKRMLAYANGDVGYTEFLLDDLRQALATIERQRERIAELEAALHEALHSFVRQVKVGKGIAICQTCDRYADNLATLQHEPECAWARLDALLGTSQGKER